MINAGFNAWNTTSSLGPLPSRRAPGNKVGISVVQNEVTNESEQECALFIPFVEYLRGGCCHSENWAHITLKCVRNRCV